MDATIRNNTVNTPDDNSAFPFGTIPGIHVESRKDDIVCLDIHANDSAHVGSAPVGVDFRTRQRDTSTFNLERLTGNAADDTNIENFLSSENNPPVAGQTANSTHATSYTAVADGTCQNPTLP